MHFIQVESPIGRIEIMSDGEVVTGLAIERDGVLPHDGLDASPVPVLEIAAGQLDEYFAGTRLDFDVPVSLAGTQFQRSVWDRISAIPHGTAVTYGRIGVDTGAGNVGRAIGGAVGANPIPIIVPCHRVLASDGRITGYSGGEGIATKAWLLDHEGVAFRMKRESSGLPRDATPPKAGR
jgi:methylated-DNA-[protein]-cysteine S-methyltransferase